MCLAVALNLLLWPGPGLFARDFLAAASQALSSTVGSSKYEAYFLRWFFRSRARAPQHETMQDRASAVARLRLNPNKLVGYENEGANFTALPTDFLDRTIQGVKLTFESSNTRVLDINEAGQARFLQPGLAWVTCRAGTAVATAPVLIRPNHRPRQTDAEWRADQAGLRLDGTLRTSMSERSGSESLLASLLDKLAPTAFAQGYPDSWADDLGYDQLWSEPRNFVGSPRNAAAEPMPLGTVLPEGSNFNWATSIYSLGGRGLAANLMLYCNGRIWSRRNNSMAFDAITGWPAPGYSLGFGRIVAYEIGTGGNPTCKYMLVEADGTRRYLGSGLWAGIGYALGGPFETSDGSHIVYTGNARDGGDLHYPDGTTVSYTTTNNRVLPTMIRDRNGNYIQIAYKASFGDYAPMAIDYVTDTLGRQLQFQYDSNYRLSAITAPGFGGTVQNPVTQTLVQFDYQTFTPTYSFTGLTVERAPVTLMRLKHIYFPATSTGYLPAYSPFGMVSSVSVRRQMGLAWPPTQNPPVITDGVESNAVSFNYPTSGSLTDAPAFTQRTQTAVNSPTSVYSYSTSTDTGAQTMTFTITRPDSTTLLLTRSTNLSSIANGKLTQSEIKNGSTSLAKTVLTYVNDGGGSPQVQSVTSYDDLGAPVKVDCDYDSKGNITNKREYGYQVSGAWKVRRRTSTTYTSIGGAFNLPTEVDVYDALLNTSDADDVILAKATYAYDNYVSMGGMEEYTGQPNPPGSMGWGASYTTRGNVTGVTQWTDLGAGATIQHLAKYDRFGNVIKAQLSCCQERDLTNTQATYWSQPESEMSGDLNGVHLTTSTDYDFNTSLPASATDAGGLVTNYGYDAALNPTYASLPTGASASAGYDYANLSSSSIVTYDDGGVTKTITTSQVYDGWGRVIQAVDRNNGQVNTAYDNMGRVSSRTNPFTAGGTAGPATTIGYDIANKAVITTLPGGNTVRSDYSGATVTATDQVNRKMKRETDGLGRLIKVTEQDVSTGALTQETNYSYNLLDKLTQVNQGNQLRTYKYDAMGRLLFERIPEQSATLNDGTGTYWSSAYAYTEFNSVKKKTDARGVESHYAFDALHRVTQTWFTGVGGDDSGAVRPALPSGVAATTDRNFTFTAWGALASVSIPNEYTETYAFDSFNRVSSITRWIGGSIYNTYNTSYQYNAAGQQKQSTYPSGKVVDISYDDRGRLGSVGPYANSMTYNIEARPTGLTLGNGVVETNTFDSNRSQLTAQTATKNGTTLMSLAYSYQASAGQSGTGSSAGNSHQLISMTGTINGVSESGTFTYDLERELVTASRTSNGVSVQRRFAYDRWGNRTAVWDAVSGGNQIQSIALQQSGGAPTNRVTSITSGSTFNYSYDSAGNVTNDGAHSYQYDAENRLASVDGGSTAQYGYDHQNRRVKKVVGGATTHYIWEGSKVIAEHDGTTPFGPYGSTPYGERSSKVEYIYAGSQMVSTRSYSHSCTTGFGGAIICTTTETGRYYVGDIWSTRLVLDSAGNVIGRQGHLPFGEEFAETGTQEKHHFTTYESDSESATDYALNREYSQGVARFQSADPYQTSQYKVNPQSWNRYTYVKNDPIHNADATGLFESTHGIEMPDPCTGGGPIDPPEYECEIQLRFKPLVGPVAFHAYIVLFTFEKGGGVPGRYPIRFRAGPTPPPPSRKLWHLWASRH